MWDLFQELKIFATVFEPSSQVLEINRILDFFLKFYLVGGGNWSDHGRSGSICYSVF